MQASISDAAAFDPAAFDADGGSWIERWVFTHRVWILAGCALLTLLLGSVAATRLQLGASFEKMIPRSHPFIQNYLDNLRRQHQHQRLEQQREA